MAFPSKIMAAVLLVVNGVQFDADLALVMSDFAKIAYCLPYTGGNVLWNCIECVKYPGTTVVPFGMGTIYGTGAYGYVAHDPMIGAGASDGRIVVSFAGTSDAMQMLRDLQCTPMQPSNGTGLVHGGMYTGYQLQQPTIAKAVQGFLSRHPGAALLVTGHSLGASHAHYAAFDLAKLGLEPTVYAFAPVRPGDQDWARDYVALVGGDRSFRVTHYMDPVPHSPGSDFYSCPGTDWRHVGVEAHYKLSVQPKAYHLCDDGGVEDRASKCGCKQYKLPLDPYNPLEAALWAYHLCYPGQCGVPRQLGEPCSLAPPFCLSPATAMANCFTGSVVLAGANATVI